MKGPATNRYLEFVGSTLEILWEKQNAPLRGFSDAPRVLTISRYGERGYWSISGPLNGPYALYENTARSLQLWPARLDVQIWNVLRDYAAIRPELRWGSVLETAVDLFAEHGFDHRTGLAYLGWETEFSVVGLGPVGCGPESWDEPKFKPKYGLPLEMLWQKVPEKMIRMMRSTYQGLVTRPEDMSFNRFCYYNFDDQSGKRGKPFSPGDCAFKSTAFVLSDWWLRLHLETGDPEPLDWAYRMIRKFLDARHPVTGLFPHMFTSADPAAVVQEPYAQVNIRDGEDILILLNSLPLWERSGASSEWIDTLREAARTNLKVIAERGWNSVTRRFEDWIGIDGSLEVKSVRYAFPTQELKDKAVKENPACANVSVFAGASLYVDGPWAYGAHCFGVLPWHLAEGARLLGDHDLLRLLDPIIEEIKIDLAKIDSEINEQGQYICSANAAYIRTLLAAYELSGQQRYLDDAIAIADRELDLLAVCTEYPEWWRRQFRSQVLEAYLKLGLLCRTSS